MSMKGKSVFSYGNTGAAAAAVERSGRVYDGTREIVGRFYVMIFICLLRNIGFIHQLYVSAINILYSGVLLSNDVKFS